jgi:hypothetical protein
MDNGLFVPLSVYLAVLGAFLVVYISMVLNLGVFSWVALSGYLSPYVLKLSKENTLRWKRYIESYEPYAKEWDESLREYIQTIKK